MGNANSAAETLEPTQIEKKTCYLCGYEVPRDQLGQHNKEVHSVVRFNWIGGQAEIVSTHGQYTQNHPMITAQPPMPNAPPPVVFIPQPPTEPQSIDSIESALINGIESGFTKIGPARRQSQHSRSVDTTVYDMDISAESGSDSDQFIEGNLFESSNVKKVAADASQTQTDEKNTTNDERIPPKRRIKKSRFNDANPVNGVTKFATSIVHEPGDSAGNSKMINVAKDVKSTAKQSKPEYKFKRPKLSVEVNDNFCELILTARVYSDSDTEFGEFPVQTIVKPKDDEVNERPQKRQRRTSSSSTVSSNGKGKQHRITNADLKKIIEQNIE